MFVIGHPLFFENTISVVIVLAVGPPPRERGGSRLGGLGCCGAADEYACAFEGVLEGGADPCAGVDVALGAQSGEGVVEVGRDTDQRGFIFHLISEYNPVSTKSRRVDGGR